MTDLLLPALKDDLTDTLPLSASVEVTPPPALEWHSATVATLSDVEDLLDCLEANGVSEREVVSVQSNLFAVRWR
jgi:hypothetical protein